jgi:hypothetical protein
MVVVVEGRERGRGCDNKLKCCIARILEKK